MTSDLCSQVPNPPVFSFILLVRSSDRTEPVCQFAHKTLFSLEDTGLTGKLPLG